MEVIVRDAHGIPDKAFISIRVGDVRRQMQFKPGEPFFFERGSSLPRHLMVDVFEKVGSAQVNVFDLKEAASEARCGRRDTVVVQRLDGGGPMSLGIDVSMKEAQSPEKPKRVSRHQAALKARTYLDDHGIQRVLQSLVHELLVSQPADPINFMSNFILKQRADFSAPTTPLQQTPAKGQAKGGLPRLDAEPKLVSVTPPPKVLAGDELPGTFDPNNPSVEIPDISNHHSITCDVLNADPGLFGRLRGLRTRSGVTLARCIKTGIDNCGSRLIRTVGAVAGDEECYEIFRELFDRIISGRHPGYDPARVHVSDLDSTRVTSELMDPSVGGESRVLSVRVCLSRNLAGLAMPPTCSLDERREVERTLAHTLEGLTADLQGEYYPLTGAGSFALKPAGMSQEDEYMLRSKALHLDEPDSEVLLSSGFGRHWPDARGVFASDAQNIVVWLNDHDHMRAVSTQQGSDLKQAFQRMCALHGALEAGLEALGYAFAKSDRLGYLGSCPSNIGTCLGASAIMRIPMLTAKPRFRTLCKQLQLQAHIGICAGIQAGEGVWEISNAERLNSTEVEQVNTVILGCRKLLELETKLERGEDINLEDFSGIESRHATGQVGSFAAPGDEMEDFSGIESRPATGQVVSFAAPGDKMVDFSSMPGLGDEDYPGFPTDACPDTPPELAKHFSLMADVLSTYPSVYDRLKDVRTKSGVSLARCIKTGVDNAAHPMIKTIGAVAGDEECYDVFSELFDPIVSIRHPGYLGAGSKHTTDLDAARVTDLPIDLTGGHVVSVSARVSRNLRGQRMPPAVTRDERREVERLLVQALESLTDELGGEYFPLRGSDSYPARPGGMTRDEEDELRAEISIFDAPDSEVLLSSGYGRQWPDARGVFVDTTRTCVVSINDQDHVCMTQSQEGPDLKGAFARLCQVHQAVESGLKVAGSGFAHSERLGFLGSCPSSLGSCLVASATICLPRLSAKSKFRFLLKQMNLQAHVAVEAGTLQDGVWDVFNNERLGSSEVDQVNTVIAGCRRLLDLEARLERGEDLDLEEELLRGAATIEEPPLPPPPAAAAREDAASHATPAWAKVDFQDVPGLGPDEYPGFPADVCPEEMPDLTGHHSLMCDVLRKDPTIYPRLRGLRTKAGTSLARCMKTGIDNKGHPMTKTIGIVAGDAECYNLYRELFDPLICLRHPGYEPAQGHPTDLDHTKVCDTPIDRSGSYVASVRIRACRNLVGLRMPPAASLDERREAERVLSEALLGLSGEMEGQYVPLEGSESCAALWPGGMSANEHAILTTEKLLFEAPDSPLVLASGAGRDWPHARGIFTAFCGGLGAWVNEEDHLSLFAYEVGADLRGAFCRFCALEGALRAAAEGAGQDFAFSPRLGYVSSDPSNLGTGLDVQAVVKLPLLSSDGLKELRGLCKQLKVKLQRTEDGVFTVSNVERLGSSEVDQVNRVADGVRLLVACESKLADGETIDLSDVDALRASVGGGH